MHHLCGGEFSTWEPNCKLSLTCICIGPGVALIRAMEESRIWAFPRLPIAWRGLSHAIAPPPLPLTIPLFLLKLTNKPGIPVDKLKKGGTSRRVYVRIRGGALAFKSAWGKTKVFPLNVAPQHSIEQTDLLFVWKIMIKYWNSACWSTGNHDSLSSSALPSTSKQWGNKIWWRKRIECLLD